MRIRLLVAVFCSLVFTVFGETHDGETVKPSNGQTVKPLKVACIGDSITFGLGLPNRKSDCYPAQLQKLLDEKFPDGYEVRNFGNSGRGIYLDSMRGSQKRGFRYMPEHKEALEWQPDIVICNLGINDNGEYIKEYSGERKRGQFIDDYCALLSDYQAVKPSNGKTVKFYIWTKLAPLADGQRFYRSPEPFLMQADLEEVAKRMNATGIDMLEPLREKMDAIFARDKIHPNAEGAKIIAETTFDALTAASDVSKVELPADVAADKRETWLCAGQSNMQKGWGEFNASPAEKDRVKKELERLAKVDIRFWDFNDGSWTKLTPQNALRKSAFGVSFAIRRAEQTGKTVCILYVAAGGAPTESFISETTMCAVGADGKPLYPHLAAIATNRHHLDRNADFPCLWVAREYPRRRDNMDEGHWWPVSLMFEQGIKRLKGLPIDGILWYQGESNATTCIAPDIPTPEDYQTETLRALVAEFRSLSDSVQSEGTLLEALSTKHHAPSVSNKAPFIIMGLPKMNRPWEQYRAVQKKVARETGCIFVDTFAAGLGEMHDVHPRDKTAFADLAIQALK